MWNTCTKSSVQSSASPQKNFLKKRQKLTRSVCMAARSQRLTEASGCWQEADLLSTRTAQHLRLAGPAAPVILTAGSERDRFLRPLSIFFSPSLALVSAASPGPRVFVYNPTAKFPGASWALNAEDYVHSFPVLGGRRVKSGGTKQELIANIHEIWGETPCYENKWRSSLVLKPASITDVMLKTRNAIHTSRNVNNYFLNSSCLFFVYTCFVKASRELCKVWVPVSELICT